MNQRNDVSLRFAAASSIGRLFAVTGAVCLFGPLAGFLFTAYTMSRRFTETLGTGSVTTSVSLHQEVGAALAVTAIGLGLGLLGMFLAGMAIFAFHFAPPWLRSALMLGALFWLPAFPIGTVLAIVLFLVVYRNPQVFVQPAAA